MSSSALKPSSSLLLTDEEYKLLPKEEQEIYLFLLKQKLAELKRTKLLQYLPNPKQEIFHLNRAHIRAVLGGNRSGKTTCGVVEFLWHMTGTYPKWYPEDMRYMRSVKGRIFCEDFQKAGFRVIVPAIEQWLDMSQVTKKTRNPIGFPVLWELKNGSSFEILTYQQQTESYEGWRGDVVWFDEPPPRDKFIATLRGLVDSGGRAWLTMTPLSQPWIYDEIVVTTQPNRFAITMDIRDNLRRMIDGIEYGHLTEEHIQRFESSLKPEEKAARIHGNFLHLTGLVYKQFDPNTHVVADMEIPSHWTRYFAIDPHPHTPCACLWMAVDEKENFWIYDELCLADMDTKQMAAAIHAQEGTDPAKIRFIDPAMDKDSPIAGGFNIRKELMRHGIFTIRANNEWDYGKDCVDRAITPKWNPVLGREAPRLHIVGPNCPRLVYEFTHYIWEYKAPKNEHNPRQKPMKKDDHLLDCLRYILTADPRYMAPEGDGADEPVQQFKGTFTKYPSKPAVVGSYRSLIEDGDN